MAVIKKNTNTKNTLHEVMDIIQGNH